MYCQINRCLKCFIGINVNWLHCNNIRIHLQFSYVQWVWTADRFKILKMTTESDSQVNDMTVLSELKNAYFEMLPHFCY